jgi:23S rRNA (adenine2503-C2)-methyltransferase
VYEALFRKGVQSFNDISTLSAPLRALFEKHFSLHPLTIDKKNSSQLDGTIRFHFLNAEQKDVSTVFLPEGGRLSLCLSSQDDNDDN